MVLVTGGTGLLGSHLLYKLAESGKDIVAIKRSESHVSHIRKIFSYYTSTPDVLFSKIKWLDGDVLDIYSLLEAMEGVQYVYHCAAVVSFHPDERDIMMKVNIEGTANVVNAALKKDVKKLCYVSSIAVFGRNDHDGIIDEETYWKYTGKNSNYALSKYYAENEVWRGINEGLNAVIVNPAIIFGPGFWHKGSNELIKTIYKGLKFITDGSNGFVDARDVAKAMVLLMNTDISSERFIISSENLSYRELMGICADYLKVKGPYIKVNRMLAEFYWRYESIKGIITGAKPLITRETAITSFEKFYYTNQKIKDAINIEFIPIEDTIKLLSDLFIEHVKEDHIKI